MKITIKNLGQLRDTTIKLGDLTIIFGKPNSGKSYILKGIYSKLAFFDQANNLDLAGILVERINKDLVDIAEKLVKEGKSEVSIDVTSAFMSSLDELSERISKSLLTINEIEIGNDGNFSDKIHELAYNTLKTKVIPNKPVYISYDSSCKTTTIISFSKGVLKLEANASEIKDQELCKVRVTLNLISHATSFFISYLVPQIMNEVSIASGIPSVKFLPYGRSLILLYGDSIKPIPYTKSLIYWIKRGIEKVRQGSFNNFWNLDIMFQDKLTINGLEPPFVSSSLLELSAVSLALADNRQSLLLIEEPESQLNMEYQLKMGVYLYMLSQKHKIVITTHSEPIISILSILAHYKNAEEIGEYLGIKLAMNRDVKIYQTKDGKIDQMDPESLIEEIPGIADVHYELLKIIAKVSKNE